MGLGLAQAAAGGLLASLAPLRFSDPHCRTAVTLPPWHSNSLPADNKGLVAGAAVATVAIAAVVASGAKGDLSEAATGVASTPAAATGAPSSAPAAAAGGSGGVAPNVAEARAWIAAWKAKHGKK